jgi:hypothetical protein
MKRKYSTTPGEKEGESKKVRLDLCNTVPIEILQSILGTLDYKSLVRMRSINHLFKDSADYLIQKRYELAAKKMLELVYDTRFSRSAEGQVLSLDTFFEDGTILDPDAGYGPHNYIYLPFNEVLNDLDPNKILDVLLGISDPSKINNETVHSLLHYFICTLRYDVIERLLKAKLSPNLCNYFGETPIHVMFAVCEARKGKNNWPSINLLQLLLDHGGNFAASTSDGETIQSLVGIYESLGRFSKECLSCFAFLYDKKAFADPEEEFINYLSETDRNVYFLEKDKISENSFLNCKLI